MQVFGFDMPIHDWKYIFLDIVVTVFFFVFLFEADNHSIMIYYPSSAGGGMKELFRKVSCRLKTHSPQVGGS